MLAIRSLRAARVVPSARAFSSTVTARNDPKLTELLGKFQDPSSPFYIAPGEVGPASPDDHTVARPLAGQEGAAANWRAPEVNRDGEGVELPPHMDPGLDRTRAAIHEWFDSNGFDGKGRIEWPVAWGESDMFKHINNVAYMRYLETQRMRWVETLRGDLGSELCDDFILGRRTGWILKDCFIKYRYPVTYPDSILMGTKIHAIDQKRASFKMSTAIWAIKANKLAVTSDVTGVLYDYDNLKKGVMSDHIYEILKKRAGEA